MDFSDANITLSGKRIREEAKKRKINQQELAELLNYSGRNEISACWNGRKFLSGDRYEKLSKEWNLRVEYLLGIDDNKTTKDKVLSSIKEVESYQELIFLLLSFHGYKVTKTEYIATKHYLYSPDNIPDSEELLGAFLWIVEKDKKKSVVLSNNVIDLLEDFYTLFETRLRPYEYMKEYIEELEEGILHN